MLHIRAVVFWRWVIRFFISLSILVFISLIWLIPVLRNIRISASILALEVAERVGSNIDLQFENALGDLSAGALEIGLEPDRVDIILRRVLKKNPGFRSIALVNSDGREITRIDRFLLVTDDDLKDHSEEPFFNLAREGASNFGSVFISEDLEPHISLAAPVRELDDINGVLVAELNLRNLVDVVRTSKLEEGTIYVVDRIGTRIIHPDLSELLRGAVLLHRSVVQKVIIDQLVADGLSSDDSYINEGGIRAFTVGLPLAFEGLGIFVEQPRSVAFANERQIFIIALTTIIFGLIGLLIIARNNQRLKHINTVLKERNQESIETGKILVRRDRELISSNTKLEELIGELDRVGKLLVRRDLELTQANARLMALDAMKSEFVSISAHQLRTPLTGIKWTLNSLIDGEFGKLRPEQLAIIKEGLNATNRLVHLIGDLLSMARLEEGRFGFVFKVRPLKPLITDVSVRSAQAAKNKKLKLTVDYSVPDTMLFRYDHEKLAIALDNLFDNAIKYTPSGGTVEVNVSVQDDKVVIKIKDTGIGIPKAQLGRVFGKFFRSPNAQLQHTDGTGLGLYIARNIVQHHGGTLTFESGEGVGTTFYLALPTNRK